jgi:hypothetical protein
VHWSLRRRAPDVLLIDVTLRRDEEIYLLLSSDRHHDHPAQRTPLETRHLELARERNAIILDFGDLFDAMQGKGDPRASYSGLADQYKRDEYFDALVNRAVERYAPYAGHFAMLATGNHEQSVLRHYGTSLTDRMAAALRERGSQCVAMPYAGWVRLTVHTSTPRVGTLTLRYSHGSGSGAMMSFGTLDTRRMQSYISADVIVQGHTHDCYVLPVAREELSGSGIPRRSHTWHIRCPSYLDDYADRGYSARTGKPPRVYGCVWGRLTVTRTPRRLVAEFSLDVEP